MWVCALDFYIFLEEEEEDDDDNEEDANEEEEEDKGLLAHYLMHRCVGHTAWAPEGRKGQSQGGPKCRKLEVYYIYMPAPTSRKSHASVCDPTDWGADPQICVLLHSTIYMNIEMQKR